MTKQFQGQGFQFSIPDGSIDRSLIFYTMETAARDGSWPTIAVSYEFLQAGENLPRFCNRQIAKLSETVTGLLVDSMRDVQLAGRAAFEVMLRWSDGAKIGMQQRLVVSELDRGKILLLSNIATQAAFEDAAPFFLSSLNSFAWDPAPGGAP